MRVCDICKADSVLSDMKAVVDNKGTTKRLELCDKCYRELRIRETAYSHKAYEETVKAMTGEIPRKFHWWNKLSW
jgi:hypothetical protein